MFKRKKAKSYLATKIENEGLDQVTTEIVGGLMRQLSGTGYMYNFILAELDGASMGNEKAKNFAKSSGIPESEYKGQHQFEHPLIDGPRGAKTILDTACLEMLDQQDLVVAFRLTVLDKLMRQVEVGKYNRDKKSESQANTASIKEAATAILVEAAPAVNLQLNSSDAAKLIENVSKTVGDSEIGKVGAPILAMFSASNATGYFIDRASTDIAYMYFMLSSKIFRENISEQFDELSAHQKRVMQSIILDQKKLAEELKE